HLGIMTDNGYSLSGTPTSVDLSDAGTTTYGTNARKALDGHMMMRMGNARPDNTLKYIGSSNDRDAILQRIGGSVPTGIASGYYAEDCTMNGQVKYTGAANDRDPILTNIANGVPTSTRSEQLP
ncbi:MAG: hypothetical protein JST45_08230, partial [Bacteroidetes bacterium]|nr:hypothetical protein [Bacteroidota bacterium]